MSESRWQRASKSAKVGAEVSTLADLLAERGVHPIRQVTVLSYVALWGQFRDAHEREPTSVDELAAGVGAPKRTVYRWQKAFRETFPEYQSPAVLWEIARGQVAGDDPKVVGMQMGAVKL